MSQTEKPAPLLQRLKEKAFQLQQDRDAVLAQLENHPAWEALRGFLKEQSEWQRPDLDDPHWKDKALRLDFRKEFAVDIVKAVEAAIKRDKDKRAAAAPAKEGSA